MLYRSLRLRQNREVGKTMNETPAWLLLVGVVFLLLLFVGIFAAIMVYFGRSRTSKLDRAAADERRLSPSTQPPAIVPEVPKSSPEPPPEMPAHPGEVMRVIRDDQTGQVLVEVAGKRYTHIREITDAQVGRRVLWAIADLVRFTGGMATNPQAVRSVMGAEPATTTQPTREPATTSPQAREDADAVQVRMPGPPQPAYPSRDRPAAAAGSVSGPTGPEPPPVRQRYSMVDYFRRGFQAPPSQPLPSPTSFVDEIEEILQGYIQNLPAPLPATVHVLTGDDGTLQIRVGIHTYGNPDEVPDPQIKQLIKAAVAEWEKR
jgi:hypothetical protein